MNKHNELKVLSELKVFNEMGIHRYSLKKLIINMSILFCLVFLLNSIVAGFQADYEKRYGGRLEININSVKAADDRTIKYKQIQSMVNYPLERLSYLNETEAYIKTEKSGYPVATVLCGENLIDFIDIRMLQGTFFNKEQHELGKKVAVISDSLALRLFMTNKVLGNKLSVAGVKYTIVGVYKKEVTPFSILYSDGAERIFIPFESVDGYNSRTINTVLISDKKFQEATFGTEKATEFLKKTGVDSSNYEINDFYNSSVYVSQPLSVFILFVGVLIILMLLSYFFRYIKDGLAFFRNRLEGGYFLEVIAGARFGLILFFSGAAVLLVSMGAIYYAVRFKGFIPYQYIPSENIFDLNFYGNLIKTGIFKANRFTGYMPTQYELWLNLNLILSYALTVCIFISFIIVKSTIKLYKLAGGYSNVKSLTILILSLLIGVAGGLLMCIVSGLQFTFPVYYTIILILYYFGKLFDITRIISSRFFSLQK